MQLDKFAEKFKPIRLDTDKYRGNCLSCAVETARLLLHSSEITPKTITDENACYSEHEALENELRIKEPDQVKLEFETGRKEKTEQKEACFKKFMQYLEELPAGSVTIADDDDHVFNFIKGYDNKIYLIDSDAHIYREVKKHDDFIAAAGTTIPDRDHDYFYSKKLITLYQVGKLDPSWNPFFTSTLNKQQKFEDVSTLFHHTTHAPSTSGQSSKENIKPTKR